MSQSICGIMNSGGFGALGSVGGSAGRVSAVIRIAKRALVGLQWAGGTKIGLWLLPISEAMR